MILAIVQARMGSSRLPGKILMDFCGKPSLYRIYERLDRSKKIDKVVIATSEDEINDPVRLLCKDNGILCFSGSEEDVLDRFYQAAKYAGAGKGDTLIRITGDCPLIDYEIIDNVVEKYKKSKVDYISNSAKPTYPDGLDCEVFSFDLLEMTHHDAKLMSEREHVTLFIRKHPERFKVENFANDKDYSYMRWTLDQKEDYVFIKQVYDALFDSNPAFLMADILQLLDKNPEMLQINSLYVRNEGLMKSLEKERGQTSNG